MKSSDRTIHLETMLTQTLLVQQSPAQAPCLSVHEHIFHLNRSVSDAYPDPTTLAQPVETVEPIEMTEPVEMAELVLVEMAELVEPAELVLVEPAVSAEPSGLAALDSHQAAY
jgi:hypothetical protein